MGVMSLPSVTIAVATYGDMSWQRLAHRRAIPSAQAQGVPVVYAHEHALHVARNGALAKIRTEWVVFLDADDELAPGYLDALGEGTADVRAPSVSYVRGGEARPPKMPRVAGHDHQCIGSCLVQGNWLVVGAAHRTELARRVGGWHDYPVYEDWDYWLRCYLSGATFEAIPSAVYVAHVRPRSRNRAPSHALKLATHRKIEAANGLAPGGTPL